MVDTQCPHCLNSITLEESHYPTGIYQNSSYFNELKDSGDSSGYGISYGYCPSPKCHKLIMKLRYETMSDTIEDFIVPKAKTRIILPNAIDKKFIKYHEEASSVLPYSARASAALSRLCLEVLLKEKYKIKNGTLKDKIDTFENMGILSSELIKDMQYIKQIGNDGAHLNTNSAGSIVDVNKKNAETLLVLLENLFDFCFVQPKERKERMNNIKKRMERKKKIQKRTSKRL